MSVPLSVGVCIYCHRADVPLNREHIIPYGWAEPGSEGDVLLKASCNTCEDITKVFEQYVLQELFGNLRKVMQLRSRRGELPKVVEQKMRNNTGSEYSAAVPIGEVVDAIFLPLLGPPGAWSKQLSAVHCELIGLQVLNVGSGSQQATYESLNADQVRVETKFKDKTFEKFLLKMGYCTAVKIYGYEKVKNSPIPRILRGLDNKYGVVLGTMPHSYLSKAPDNHTWLQYGSFNTPNGIVSAIKLFAAIDSLPEYHVVVTSSGPGLEA
jgi:hypothetical protein